MAAPRASGASGLFPQNVLGLDFISEFLPNILALYPVDLLLGVSLNELVGAHVATTNTDVDLVFVNFDHHAFRAELVNTF